MKKMLIEWCIAVLVAAVLVFIAYRTSGVDTEASEIVLAAEPNMVFLEEELDELEWKLKAQQSVGEQIKSMVKE